MTINTQYLLSVFGGVFSCFFFWFLAFYAQLGLPTSTSQWATDLFDQKTLVASHMKGTRLFILGGSGTHFSVSAEKMSKALGMPTINFGTYAGLEAEYFIYKIKKVLRPGDLVLLPLEYNYYTDRPRDNYSYIDHLIARDPEFFRSFPLAEQLKIALSLPVSRLKKPFKEKFSSKSKGATSAYYTVYHNYYGDTHINNRVFVSDLIRVLRENSSIDGGLFAISEKSRIWQELRSFSKWCKEKNITLLATVPNHQYFENINKQISQATIKKIKHFYSSIGVPFLGDPFKAMFERSLYFDTSYHMNDLGKELYTDYLIHLLKNTEYVKGKQTANQKTVPADDNPLEKVLARFNGWEPLQGMALINNSLDSLPATVTGSSDIILQVQLIKQSKMVLLAEMKAAFAKRKVSILVDEKPLWQNNYLKTQDFSKVSFSILLPEGKHLIRIKTDERMPYSSGTALLFNALTITSEEVMA